jgi:LacI family transcriptional regulator
MKKKKVTLKDIARAAEVSTAAVSLVLNRRQDFRISEEKRRLILAAADRLGYRIPAARSNERPVVFFVHSHLSHMNITTSFFSRVASAFRTLGWEHGYTLIEIEMNVEELPALYKMMMDSGAAAFVSFSRTFLDFHERQENNIPLFFLQGEHDAALKRTIEYQVDDRAVGRRAAEHLASRGYRRTGLIFPAYDGRCSRDRIETFIDYYEKNGLFYKHHDIGLLDSDVVAGFFETLDLTAYDSFYFFSDAMAIPAIRCLSARKILMPEEIGIIATDNLYWGKYIYPSLTTMDLKEGDFARQIIEDLNVLRKGGPIVPRNTVIPVELLVRESTGRPS